MSIPPHPRRPGTRATRFARGLGYAVNPFVLPPALFALVAAAHGAPGAEVLWVGAVALVGFGLVPLAYVLALLRRGRIASAEIVDRRARVAPLFVALAASGVTLGVLWATTRTAAPLVVALAALHLVDTAVLFAITLWWKISLHAAALGGVAAVLALVGSGALGAAAPGLSAAGVLAGAVLPLLMWARVRAGVHTPAQTAGGALAGVVLPTTQLLALRAAGLLA